MFRKLAAFAALAVVLVIAPNARAAIISSTNFFLTQPECTGTCGSGTAPAVISDADAVEVTVDLLTGGATATVIFTAPTVGSHAGSIGVPIELNVSGDFIASSTEPLAPSSPCGPGTTSPHTACSPGSEDHYGTMDLETGAVSASTITINLSLASGTWANADAVLMPTTGFAAAYSQGFEAETSYSTQDAGFIAPGGSGTGTVPEPGTLALLATALIGFGWYRGSRRALSA